MVQSILWSRSIILANALGPVDRFDPLTNQLEVLGQVYHVDDDTLIFNESSESPSLDEIEEGTFIEVSALSLEDGSFLSTRVDILGQLDFFLVFGPISALDITERTLVVGGLTVDFSETDIAQDVIEALELGLEVVAAGLLREDSEALILEAIDLSIIDDEGNFMASNLTTSGVITEFESLDTFYVASGVVPSDQSAKETGPLAVTENTLIVNGENAEVVSGAHIIFRAAFNSELNRYEILELEFIEKVLPTIFDLNPITSPSFSIGPPRIYAPLDAVDFSTADELFNLGQVLVLSQPYIVKALRPTLFSEDTALSDVSEFQVGDWFLFEFDSVVSNSSNLTLGVVHASSIDELERIVLTGQVQYSNTNQSMELLNQTIIWDQDTRCFSTSGFDEDCAQLSDNPLDKLYIEGVVQGNVILAVYIVKL